MVSINSKRGRTFNYSLAYLKGIDPWLSRPKGRENPPVRLHSKKFFADMKAKQEKVDKVIDRGAELRNYIYAIEDRATKSNRKKLPITPLALKKKIVPVMVQYELASLAESRILNLPKRDMPRVRSSGRMHDLTSSFGLIKMAIWAMEGNGLLKRGFFNGCLSAMDKAVKQELKRMNIEEEMDRYYGKAFTPLSHAPSVLPAKTRC